MTADPLATVIRHWAATEYAERPLTARQLISLARGPFRKAIHATSSKGQATPSTLGVWLAANKDLLCEGYRVRSTLDSRNNTQLWHLARMTDADWKSHAESIKPPPADIPEAPEFVVTSASIRNANEAGPQVALITLRSYQGSASAHQIADALKFFGTCEVLESAASTFSVRCVPSAPGRLADIQETVSRRFPKCTVDVVSLEVAFATPKAATTDSRLAALGVTRAGPGDWDPFPRLEAKARAEAHKERIAAAWARFGF